MIALFTVAPQMRGLNIVRGVPPVFRERDDVVDRAAHGVSARKPHINRPSAQLADVVVSLEDLSAIHGRTLWVHVRLALTVTSRAFGRIGNTSLGAIHRFWMEPAGELLPAMRTLFCDGRTRLNHGPFAVLGSPRLPSFVAFLRTALSAFASDKHFSAMSARRLDRDWAKVSGGVLRHGEPAHWALLGELALGCIRAIPRAIVKAVGGLRLVWPAAMLARRHDGIENSPRGSCIAAMDVRADRRATHLPRIPRLELLTADCACLDAGLLYGREHAFSAANAHDVARLNHGQQRAADFACLIGQRRIDGGLTALAAAILCFAPSAARSALKRLSTLCAHHLFRGRRWIWWMKNISARRGARPRDWSTRSGLALYRVATHYACVVRARISATQLAFGAAILRRARARVARPSLEFCSTTRTTHRDRKSVV